MEIAAAVFEPQPAEFFQGSAVDGILVKIPLNQGMEAIKIRLIMTGVSLVPDTVTFFKAKAFQDSQHRLMGGSHQQGTFFQGENSFKIQAPQGSGKAGQPLHAFDLDKVSGNHIIVKNLPEGTKFTTLDGVERTLSADDLMICDEKGGACIAGVFGGLNSGVTEQTTTVFLESAYFNLVHHRICSSPNHRSRSSHWS